MESLRVKVTIEIEKDELEGLFRAFDLPAPDEGLEGVEPPQDNEVELPPSWRLVEERHGVTYTWGEDRDVYDPFLIYEGDLSSGPVRLAIGKCERARTFGQDRVYYIAISIGPAGGMRAISEFLATDDYEETGDVIAIIKGKEGSGRQFDDSDSLPSIYSRWSTAVYRDRVDYPGAYSKQALVCSEGDYETMLNHSLAQIQLRDLGG